MTTFSRDSQVIHPHKTQICEVVKESRISFFLFCRLFPLLLSQNCHSNHCRVTEYEVNKSHITMEEKELKDTRSLVKLRQRKLSNDSISLYLGIYNNDKCDCEFLKLNLVDAKTRQNKKQKRQILATHRLSAQSN